MPHLLLLLLLLLLRRCATAGCLLLLLNSQQLHPGWQQSPLLMQGTQLVQALLLRLRRIKLPVVRQWLHVRGDDSTIDALLHTVLRNWLLIAAWDLQAMPAGLAAHVLRMRLMMHLH